MASWKKVLVSGSTIEVNQITASGIPTIDNESNLLAIGTDGGVTQITQGSIAGTNPTFNIVAINSSSTTNTDFNTSDQLIFSHSLDHGFGFTITDSGTTSSISLQTPQDLRTTASPQFNEINIDSNIYHTGDTDTRIEFVDDQILFHAGGVKLLSLVEGGTDNVVINQDSNDVDFRVEGNTDPYLLFVEGGTDKVAIGTQFVNHNSLFTVDGTIYTAGITASQLPINDDAIANIAVIVSGSSGGFEKRDIAPLIQSTAGNYTASFSSSITGTANEIEVTGSPGNVVIGLTNNVTIPNNLTVTNDTSLGNNLDLTGGNITVAGNISASGDITASNIQVDNDIALGGNIFSFSGFSFIEGVSANFTSSNVFGSGSAPGANDTAGGGTAHQFTGSVAITGSVLALDEANLTLDNGNITLDTGNVTADNGTGSFGYVKALEISSSGHLYALLPNDQYTPGGPVSDGVVVYDTNRGQLMFTASAAVGITNFPDLNSIPNLLVSGAIALSSDSQGTYDLDVGTVTVSDNISSGLTTSDSPSFVGVTTTGGLTISGGTSSFSGPITASSNLQVSGQISGSSHLFASLSLDSSALSTVMYNTATGQFFHTGSYGGVGVSYNDIADIPSNIVSSSLFSSNNQGGVTASINGVTSSFDVGLTTSDSPTFDGLTTTGNVQLGNASSDTVTIAGDLIVQGNTTSVNTTNLHIEDTFILLASGSATDTSAGIVVERSANGVGTALFWDASKKLWSVDVDGANGPGNSATVDRRLATIAHDTGLPSNPGYGSSASSYAESKGQMFVDTDDDFGLYVWL